MGSSLSGSTASSDVRGGDLHPQALRLELVQDLHREDSGPAAPGPENAPLTDRGPEMGQALPGQAHVQAMIRVVPGGFVDGQLELLAA